MKVGILGDITHIAIGFLVGFISFVNGALAIVLTMAFIAYQYFDYKAEGSKGVVEMLEFYVGVLLGAYLQVGGVIHAG